MVAAAECLDLTEADVALSFLPLSHAFERLASFLYLYTGATLVFAETIDTIARDIANVRPTLITGVPRVYEKMQARIMEKGRATPGLKGALFAWAIDVGTRRAHAELRGRPAGPLTVLQWKLADRLVSRK